MLRVEQECITPHETMNSDTFLLGFVLLDLYRMGIVLYVILPFWYFQTFRSFSNKYMI